MMIQVCVFLDKTYGCHVFASRLPVVSVCVYISGFMSQCFGTINVIVLLLLLLLLFIFLHANHCVLWSPVHVQWMVVS